MNKWRLAFLVGASAPLVTPNTAQAVAGGTDSAKCCGQSITEMDLVENLEPKIHVPVDLVTTAESRSTDIPVQPTLFNTMASLTSEENQAQPTKKPVRPRHCSRLPRIRRSGKPRMSKPCRALA
jgi:hypothetical protein